MTRDACDCCSTAALPSQRVADACDRALAELAKEVATRWPEARADRVKLAARPAFTLFGKRFWSREITLEDAEREIRDAAKYGDAIDRCQGRWHVEYLDGRDDATLEQRRKLQQLKSLALTSTGTVCVSTRDFARISGCWL